jgi:hypothetical protein
MLGGYLRHCNVAEETDSKIYFPGRLDVEVQFRIICKTKKIPSQARSQLKECVWLQYRTGKHSISQFSVLEIHWYF